jgi:hypothetical protein
LIDERQRELRTAALALAQGSMRRNPRHFAIGIAGYWRVWRHEKKPGIEAAETAA